MLSISCCTRAASVYYTVPISELVFTSCWRVVRTGLLIYNVSVRPKKKQHLPIVTYIYSMFPIFLSLLLARLILAVPTCSLVAAPPNTPSNSSSNSTSGGPSSIVAAAWYAAWHSTDYPLQNVSWSKYSSLIYAFA